MRTLRVILHVLLAHCGGSYFAAALALPICVWFGLRDYPGLLAVGAIAPLVVGTVDVSDDGRRLSAGVDASTGLATAVVRALDSAGVLVDNIEVRQPSLDDVFFSLTGGHIIEEVVDASEDGSGPGDGAEAADYSGNGHKSAEAGAMEGVQS